MEKCITINADENLEDTLYRVNKGTILTLRPSPKFLALGVSVSTNYPVKKGAKFNRTQYYELSVSADHQDLISSSFNWHVTILLELAGSFRFKCLSQASGKILWESYVVVNPELKIPLDLIRCQTVLSKNLGPLADWRKRLAVTRDARYNMIHFTPVQELGFSNSAYSLRNQLKINPMFKTTLNDIKKEVEFMEKKWNILSVTDIVLNHTSFDSAWIKEHPECAYNLQNSPHLRPAFVLDTALIWFQVDLERGALEKSDNLTKMIKCEQQLSTIRILLNAFYIPQLKIYEFYEINIANALDSFDKLPRSDKLVVDFGLYERQNGRVVSFPASISTKEHLRSFLEAENRSKRRDIESCLRRAVENVINTIRYERLNPDGPYYGEPVSEFKPLVPPYFTHLSRSKFRLNDVEELMCKNGQQFMVHNGWLMNSSSSEDFVSPSSFKLLNRELVAWGDCIKLRYGSGPTDCPYLWEHMRKYVESQAKVFHGFRIDNCHSTPLHVAEYLLDAARVIRPDVYIMAELFTDSEATDNKYVNHLGITSLIRESMAAHDARELGRLMYRFGGTPVGAFYQQGAEPLKPGTAHAIFYDQTHDNEAMMNKRGAYNLSAVTSIINMACCATGSSRGYDELVPHHINVVSENRLYAEQVDENAGLLPLRRFLNGPFSKELANGFSEIFVDQVNDDVIAITRHNPFDGRSIVMVACTAFNKEPIATAVKPIEIQGRIDRIIFEAQLTGNPNEFKKNDKFINGLPDFKIKILNTNFEPSRSELAKIVNGDNDMVRIEFDSLAPSSVLIVETILSSRQSEALKSLNNWGLDLSKLDMNDANYILFRCAEEDGIEPYELPGFCKFTYCGLYGLQYYLEKVRENQDQAHPLAMNLRKGNWLSDSIISRLKLRPSTKALAENLKKALKQVSLLPRGMVPKYFDLIITQLYNAVLKIIYSRMSVFVTKGPRLVKLLVLSSVALIGDCESAPLPNIESKLSYTPSIAAGLPHFASGFMRNWGRDTFIALRGLMLVTGRFAEARSIILSYARTLRHGLIPNLLDGGEKSRYNCRDAVWWWLYSIKEYTRLAPNGSEILRLKVKRIHKPEPPAAGGGVQRKRSVAQMNGSGEVHVQYLCDIMQEALECHFKGMEFVEENAGKQLDEHMKPEGFNITYGVDRETGFVFGGNEYNCGTWMDKMGSSEKASTKGKPATPRDGSAVELIGLSKAVISWLDDFSKNGRLYPYDGVECLYDNTITLEWTWKKWADLIQRNFEKYFYVPLADEPVVNADPNPDLINRRGIYKDTLGATLKWQDYQLRPNFLITMVIAPELFDSKHARTALDLVRTQLCGPQGIKTLDPTDWNYRGDYDNANDSDDPKIAHGYNYHNGPEWVWLMGYYIRASSKFHGLKYRGDHLQILANFYATLTDSPWVGLPELTNSNGAHCKDSCPIQAWSLGTALEALHESVRNSSNTV